MKKMCREDTFHEDYENKDYIKDYCTVEFVAIPPDFDIMNYLSLSEQAGIFSNQDVNMTHLKIIAESVKYSPVFKIMNNLNISNSTCIYFLKVINEMGLILKSIDNPIRNDIEYLLNNFNKNYPVYIKGMTTSNIQFIIINIFPMMSDGIVEEAMEIAQKLQNYQTQIDENLKTIKDL